MKMLVAASPTGVLIAQDKFSGHDVLRARSGCCVVDIHFTMSGNLWRCSKCERFIKDHPECQNASYWTLDRSQGDNPELSVVEWIEYWTGFDKELITVGVKW